jgi:hypothetical protein
LGIRLLIPKPSHKVLGVSDVRLCISVATGGGGASAAISLDHFFHSLKQYYYSLSRDSAHKATPTGCSITPQELEGLKNVLKIIQTIAKHVCLS